MGQAGGVFISAGCCDKRPKPAHPLRCAFENIYPFIQARFHRMSLAENRGIERTPRNHEEEEETLVAGRGGRAGTCIAEDRGVIALGKDRTWNEPEKEKEYSSS